MKPLVVALALFTTGTALAHEARRDEPEPERSPSSSRFEVSFGFLAGERSLPSGSFAAQDLAGAITVPYGALDSDSVRAYGPRIEWRSVHNHVRTSLGLQWPHPAFGSGQLTLLPIGGDAVPVVTRSISVFELRLGIGAEAKIWKLRPFVDLVGDMQWVSATLATSGNEASYSARRFGYGVTGGLSIPLGEGMFLAAAGEAGLTGAMRWGAQLMIGGSFEL